VSWVRYFINAGHVIFDKCSIKKYENLQLKGIQYQNGTMLS